MLDTSSQLIIFIPLSYHHLFTQLSRSSLLFCSTQFVLFFSYDVAAQSIPRYPHSWEFCDTQRRTTVNRTPLYEWSSRRRDLYLTTHNTHNRHTSMPPVGFKPTISAGQQPQTYVLDRAVTGTDRQFSLYSSTYVQKFVLLHFFFVNIHFKMQRILNICRFFVAVYLRLPSFCDMTPRHWTHCYKCLDTG